MWVLLYDSSVSGNCYKVRLLLAHLGLPYERHEVDVVHRRGRKELLGQLDPALRVPTLVLEDGRPLAESGAILHYLAEGTPYLPEDRFERAQVLPWMFFEQYNHEPNVAVVRYWVSFAASRPPEEEIEARRALGHLALAAMESPSRPHAASSWPSATRSPTSPSTPTPTSPRRAASSWPAIPPSAPGSSGWRPAGPRADHRLSGPEHAGLASVTPPRPQPRVESSRRRRTCAPGAVFRSGVLRRRGLGLDVGLGASAGHQRVDRLHHEEEDGGGDRDEGDQRVEEVAIEEPDCR